MRYWSRSCSLPYPALNDTRRRIDIKLSAGKIVEEKERLGAMGQHVIDAHGHQIDAYRIVTIKFDGQFELGAHAVSAGNQNRLAVAFGYLEQRAETAETAEHALAQGFFGEWLDALDEGVAGIDVDAGITVGKGGLRGWLSHLGVPNEACTHGGGKIRVLLLKC